ncbi:hypothetical protein Bbelb_036040 [Branchiostoma belcheri]|nr:hypothetical protein Bbelb_036040 [Branchiostoma belcheri]
MGVSSRTVCRVISENTAIMRSTPIPETREIWAYDNVNIMVNVQLLRQTHSAKMIDTRKSNRQRDRIMKPECYKFVGPVDRSDQMVCYLSVRRRTLKRPCGDGEGVAGEGWASGCGVQPHPDVCPMTDISMNQRARVIQPVLTLVLSKCRDTLYVESFNNACLQYLDKRIFSGSTKYSLRMYLAILDWPLEMMLTRCAGGRPVCSQPDHKLLKEKKCAPGYDTMQPVPLLVCIITSASQSQTNDEPIKPLPLYEIGDSLPTPDTWADLRRDLSFLAAESLPDTAREHGIDLVETSVVKLHFIWSHPTGVDLWIYVKNVSPHLNHGPEDESVEARRVTCRMLAAVETDPSQPARRVYDEVVQEEEDMANVPNFRTVRTQLERRRAAFAPRIPHDVDDVVIPGQWAETWDGRQFLSHQDNEWGFIVFATDRNYRKMGRCRVLYMDGAFKSCPEPYYQVLTIHGLYHGRVIPFVMALLVDKTVGAYRALLDHEQRKVRQESGHRLRPDQIVADFEVGLMAAYQTEFPEADTSGCYYHFTQNLWKHIQQLGLARPYRQDEHLKKFLRKIMAIGYLPGADELRPNATGQFRPAPDDMCEVVGRGWGGVHVRNGVKERRSRGKWGYARCANERSLALTWQGTRGPVAECGTLGVGLAPDGGRQTKTERNGV